LCAAAFTQSPALRPLSIDFFGLVAAIATLPASKAGERKRVGVSPSFARARRRR
jgi:hypothetical protein